MGRIRVTLGTTYMEREQIFVVRELLSGSRLLVENTMFGDKKTIARNDLDLAWASGAVCFAIEGPNTRKLTDKSIALSYTFADFETLPEKHRKEAWRKYELILPLLKLPSEELTRQYIETYARSLRSSTDDQADNITQSSTATIRRSGGRKGVKIGMAASRASLERWLGAFEQSGYDIRSLVPGIFLCGGSGQHRLKGVKEEAINEILAECKAHPAKRTVDDVYLKVVQRVLEKVVTAISLHPPDRYSGAEIGVQLLIERIDRQHALYDDILVCRRQLLESITRARHYGENEAHTNERSVIIERLEALSTEALGLSFSALSRSILPSESTVYRRIVEIGAPFILRRRRSQREAQAENAGLPAPPVSRALECIELDHTKIDAFVVDENDRFPIGRPTFTFARDKATGSPYGLFIGFEPPSYLAAMHCMLHGILPKGDVCKMYGTANPWYAFGLMEMVVTDLGPEFRGLGDFSTACVQLGAIHQKTPARMPWLKGSIERAIRSSNSGLLHLLPGTTLSNFLERGDYDPSRDACISLSALYEIVHIYLLDSYAQDTHNSVGGVPAKLWKEQVRMGFEPLLYHNAEEVRMFLLRSETGAIQRGGIEFETLYYQSPELIHLRSNVSEEQRTHMQYKYDPGDLGAIYILDPGKQGRWLRIPAVAAEYATGLSLWKHRVIRRYVREQMIRDVDIYALAHAKQLIQQIAEREFKLTRKTQSRSTAARFLGIGSGPAPSTGISITSTPALPSPSAGGLTPTPLSPDKLVAGAYEEPEDLDMTGFGSDLGLPINSNLKQKKGT